MKIFDEIDVDFSALGFKQTKINNLILSSLDIQQDNKNFKKGKYKIVSCHNLYLHSDYQKEVVAQLKKILKEFLRFHKIKQQDKVLVCGLGNADIISDSLGIKTCKKILATNNFDFSQKKHNICTICPGVQAETGLQTFDIVNGIVKSIDAKLVILIDSLLTENIKRLGHCFQLSSVGMVPGGALLDSKEISLQTIGVPCISIGVPLLLDLKGVTDKVKKSIIVAPKDIKHYVLTCADIISTAINCGIGTTLTRQQILETLKPF